jgi:transposase
VYMDDNAPVHRARVVQTALQDGGIPRMDWPACSPDLNVIEHAWDMLGRALKSRNPPIQTLNELCVAVVEEWDRIPLQDLRKLVASCPRRIQAVIASHGGYTKY